MHGILEYTQAEHYHSSPRAGAGARGRVRVVLAYTKQCTFLAYTHKVVNICLHSKLDMSRLRASKKKCAEQC